jgi:catechol 2,3-dioxygenase-like lactoylglutathione lyase family enzyme
MVVQDDDAGIAFYVGRLGFRLAEDIDRGRKRWVTVEPPRHAAHGTVTVWRDPFGNRSDLIQPRAAPSADTGVA